MSEAKNTPAVIAAAKALARQHADACNVNVIDLWQFEGETFMEDARKVLDAVAYDALLAALQDARGYVRGGTNGEGEAEADELLARIDVAIAAATGQKGE